MDAPPASAEIPAPAVAPTSEANRGAIERFVADWERDWEGGADRFRSYGARYAPTFRAAYRDMDREAWLADKQRKAERAGCLEISVGGLEVLDGGDERVEVRFEQRFVSDTWCDAGPKALTLERSGTRWQIVAEEQPQATQCAERCVHRGDPVAGYVQSCRTVFRGEYGARDECEDVAFEQNCAPDPFGCASTGEDCDNACTIGCRACQDAAAAACEDCRRPCGDDAACVRACAEARSVGRTACLSQCEDCRGDCAGAESTCVSEMQEKADAACPRCEEMRQCTGPDCRERFADQAPECHDWCAHSDV